MMDKPGDSGKNTRTVSRGTFFKWASVALLIPFFKILASAVESKTKTEAKIIELSIEPDLSDGVHFFEKIILIKNEDKFRLMISRCSHLGCRIDKEENGYLVCPCHGSRYDLQGKPVKGPANKPLEEVQFEILKTNENVVLRYKS